MDEEALERTLADVQRSSAERYEAFSKQLVIESAERYEAFVREIVARLDAAGARQDAIAEHMIGRLDALTDAVMRLVDRFANGGEPAT